MNDRHPPSARATEQSQLATRFDLGRQITSVLDLDELLHQVPVLIARLIDFDAFAVYLLDRRRGGADDCLCRRLPGARGAVPAHQGG